METDDRAIALRRSAAASSSASDAELLAILAELAREVSSVLDLDDLLEKIPNLISRLTNFTVFSVYLLDEQREELSIAYAVGYPEEIVKHFTLQGRPGHGRHARSPSSGRSCSNDVDQDPRYLAVVPGAKSQLAVPLRNKGKVIGALNLLSDKLGAFTERDEWILRQFGAHVAQAIATARLFESEREYAETLETLAEIGREMSAILDPDELLTRLAHLIKRVIDYRIFGIALLDEETQMLELKVDDQVRRRSARDGAGEARRGPGRLRGAAQGSGAGPGRDEGSALHRRGSRRALGAGRAAAAEGSLHRRVRPREPGARRVQQEARQAADAARVGSGGGDRERAALRIDSRQRSALREGTAASRSACRWRCCRRSCRSGCAAWMWRGISIRRASSAATSATSSRPKPNTLVVVLGDVSGKGVPAALYGAAIGEMVRGRTFRRRLEKNVDARRRRCSPA